MRYNRHIKLFWDPDRETFMDEDGFEIWPYYIQEFLPIWALNLARVARDSGETYWCYTSNGYFIEIFWPDDEEAENWYL